MIEDLEITSLKGTADKNLAALVALTLHLLVSERHCTDLVKIVLADGTGNFAVHTVADGNRDNKGCCILVHPVILDDIQTQEQ